MRTLPATCKSIACSCARKAGTLWTAILQTGSITRPCRSEGSISPTPKVQAELTQLHACSVAGLHAQQGQLGDRQRKRA